MVPSWKKQLDNAGSNPEGEVEDLVAISKLYGAVEVVWLWSDQALQWTFCKRITLSFVHFVMNIVAVSVYFLISCCSSKLFLSKPMAFMYCTSSSPPMAFSYCASSSPLSHLRKRGSDKWHALVSTKLGSTLSKPWHQALPELCLWCWKPPVRRCAGWMMPWTDPELRRGKGRKNKELCGFDSRSCDSLPGMLQTGHAFSSKTWTKIGQHPVAIMRSSASCQTVSWPEKKANGPFNCFPNLSPLQIDRFFHITSLEAEQVATQIILMKANSRP